MKNILLFTTLVFLISCDLSKNSKVEPSASFIKVYDDNSSSTRFYPLDIEQTSDGGFIILCKANLEGEIFPIGTHLIWIDNLGKFKSSVTLENSQIYPQKDLIKQGTNYYIVCTNIAFYPKLLIADEAGTVKEVSNLSSTEQYPLAMYSNGTDLQLFSYDKINYRNVISTYNFSGNKTSTKLLDPDVHPSFDPEQSIYEHYTGKGKTIPYFIGKLPNGKMFVNGYYQQNISTIFFNYSSSTDSSIIYGYKDENLVSAMTGLNNGKLLFTYSLATNNYIAQNFDFSFTSGNKKGIGTFSNNYFSQNGSGTNISTKEITLNGKSLITIIFTTVSKQIGLHFYSKDNGELLGTKYISSGDPLEYGSLTATTDGGLAVVGTQFIAGRLPKVTLIKLSKTEVESIVK
jgi:hypothetical protein